MAIERVLITVKTYPTLSNKYDELVCTAGVREDGTWVRIYPIPFRKMDYESRYSKYQWIELDLVRNTADPRPESFRPVNYDAIDLCEKIGTDNGFWTTRKKYVLNKVYTNFTKLINEAKDKNLCTSLAVFKPRKILNFKIEQDDRNWDKKKLERLNNKAKQLGLFEKSDNPIKIVRKIPFKFSYEFIDDQSKVSTLMIEDWEICQLYWNCLKRSNGDESKACNDVKNKYYEDFAKTKDLYLFLGTTRAFHFVAPNPFIIIGTFHPKKQTQASLF